MFQWDWREWEWRDVTWSKDKGRNEEWAVWQEDIRWETARDWRCQHSISQESLLSLSLTTDGSQSAWGWNTFSHVFTPDVVGCRHFQTDHEIKCVKIVIFILKFSFDAQSKYYFTLLPQSESAAQQPLQKL